MTARRRDKCRRAGRTRHGRLYRCGRPAGHAGPHRFELRNVAHHKYGKRHVVVTWKPGRPAVEYHTPTGADWV